MQAVLRLRSRSWTLSRFNEQVEKLLRVLSFRNLSKAEGLENVVNYSYLGTSVDEKGEVSAVVQHAQNTTSGTSDTILFVPYPATISIFRSFRVINGNVKFQAQLVPELFPIGEGLDEFEVLSEDTVTVTGWDF